MESKELKVLAHLKKHHSITSWEAIKLFRATRLSAIIFNLRERGYDIRSVMEYNEETGTRFARYVLIKSIAYDEEDLFKYSKEEFLARFDVSDEEYEMLHKEMQEM